MIVDQLFTPKPLQEGGPYDLPGIDYPRSGDTPRKQSSGEQNPYPYSPEEDDDYFREIFRKKREAAAKDPGMAEGAGRAVNDKGLTQQRWLQLVQTKFPDAKIVQAKIIDGPCRATLPNGRTLSWVKAEQDVAEGMFGSRSSPVLPIVDKISKVARELTPQNVEVGKQIIQSKTNEITRVLSPQVQSGVDVIEQDMEEGLGYSQDPAQAKWYHEGRRAFKGGTTGNLIQDIAKKHGCPPEWIDAFHAGYEDQQGFAQDDVPENAQKSMPFYGTNPATGQARTYDELLAKSQAGTTPATPNFAPQGSGYKSMNTGINLPTTTAPATPAVNANTMQTKKIKKSSSDSFTPDEISKMSPFVQKQLSGIKEALTQPVAEMLQMVETKEDVQRIKQFVDQTFTKYGAVNESAFALRNQILEHVTQAGAQRRREHSRKAAH